MSANPNTVVSLNTPALEATLPLYSPDESNAQRFSARLRHLVMLSWCDSRQLHTSRQLIEEHQPRVALLDFSRDNIDTSTELVRQLGVLAPDLVLVGTGSTSTDRGAGVLAAMRAGIKHFVDIDSTDEEILAQLNAVLTQAQRKEEATAPTHARRGQLIVVCGVRPGLGASALTTHLGALAASAKPEGDAGTQLGNSVLLLDLGHSRGDISLYMGLRSDFHFHDALRHAGRIDATLVRTALPHHTSGAAVLDAAKDQPVNLGGAEVVPLLDRLLCMYDLVLCDLDYRQLDQAAQSVLKMADEIWLLTDQTIGAMVSLDACLKQLEQAGPRDLRVSLVVNRYDEETGLSVARIAERFHQAVLATLPDRSRALRMSANQGVLLHDASPSDAYVRALAPLMARFRLRVNRDLHTSPLKTLTQRIGGSLWKHR